MLVFSFSRIWVMAYVRHSELVMHLIVPAHERQEKKLIKNSEESTFHCL